MPAAGRVTDIAMSTLHAHAPPCVLCPHTVAGPAITGATRTLFNNLAPLRTGIGDGGVHVVCCRKNAWMPLKTLAERFVLVEGQPLFCQWDITLHCSVSVGTLTTGSPDVIVGENL